MLVQRLARSAPPWFPKAAMKDPLSTTPVNRRVLIGQYDSPYVRRVAIALQIYGIEYEQRPWSVMRDAAKIAQYNPLRRVPTLILPGGQILVESHLILDALDEEVSDDVVLLPRRGPVRRRGLQICGLSMGLADKAVSLIYDGLFRDEGAPRQRWIERCEAQVTDTALRLEQVRAGASGEWLLGAGLSHADVALAVAWRLTEQGAPRVCAALDVPAIRAHSARCEAMDVFERVHLPLTFPT